MAGEDSDNGEKTEEPTSQRREDFRKQGQVAQSKELATVMALFGVSLLMWFLGSFFLTQMSDLFRGTYANFISTAARSGDYVGAVKFCFMKGAFVVGPVLAMSFVIGVSSTLLQIGFLSSGEVIKPNLDKINPIKGLQRVFSLKAFFEGMKAILKITLVGIVVYFIIESEFENAPFLMNFGIGQIIQYFGSISLKLISGVGLFMAILAIMDYGFQRWDLEKKMRMTKQEVKEEVKNREGDPQVKARIRRIQRELATKRMMQEVPKADVIITNPTHLAIAIRYGVDLPAPQVIAKGAGVVAERIRELAKEHKIPIVENKPLARTLFKAIKVGQVIPKELYNAVAEVLAYVFRIRKRIRK